MDFKYYGLVNTSNVLRPYRLSVIYLSSLSLLSPSLTLLPSSSQVSWRAA